MKDEPGYGPVLPLMWRLNDMPVLKFPFICNQLMRS